MNVYFNGQYYFNNPTWHEEDSEWKADQIINLLKKNDLNLIKIAEVGCGAGGILYWLKTKYNPKGSYCGYEISPDAYKLCSKKTTDNLDFKLGDICSYGDNYDLLLVIDILEHLENYNEMLRNIKSKSKYKIFHIPLDLSVQTVMRDHPMISVRSSVGHIHYFTKNIALAVLKEAGYKILDYKYTTSGISLPKRSIAKLAAVPRILAFKLNEDLAARWLGGFSLLVLTE